MTRAASDAVLSGLLQRLNAEERALCQYLSAGLLALGYQPQRERVQGYVLAFRNRQLGQTLAKLGVRRDGGRLAVAVKLYACRPLPGLVSDAVRQAVERSHGQYRCVDCGVCGAAPGERGYPVTYPAGEPFIRCGAYVVELPALRLEDLAELSRLLSEQHQYFLARGG